MDQTLALLATADTSSIGAGMIMSSSDEASSTYDYENEAEIELGLGLSLTSASAAAGGVGKGKLGLSSVGEILWGNTSTTSSDQYAAGRILTAKDLPNGRLSGTGRAAAAANVCGTKRAAADLVTTQTHHTIGPPAASSAALSSSQVVGWPPIRAYRMNSLVNQSKVPNVEVEEEEDQHKGVGGNEKKAENSKKKINCGRNYHNNNNTNNNNIDDNNIKEKGHLGFIKVNIDGLPIGRKVDLNAHTCYESLAQVLEDMFFRSNTTMTSISGGKEQAARQTPKLLDESSEFVLTYEDKEGDWMLIGDVPWRMFLSTVKRLRIMRTSEANGLAPRPQEKHERQKGKPI